MCIGHLEEERIIPYLGVRLSLSEAFESHASNKQMYLNAYIKFEGFCMHYICP
jgi:hypothetical protein